MGQSQTQTGVCSMLDLQFHEQIQERTIEHKVLRDPRTPNLLIGEGLPLHEASMQTGVGGCFLKCPHQSLPQILQGIQRNIGQLKGKNEIPETNAKEMQICEPSDRI